MSYRNKSIQSMQQDIQRFNDGKSRGLPDYSGPEPKTVSRQQDADTPFSNEVIKPQRETKFTNPNIDSPLPQSPQPDNRKVTPRNNPNRLTVRRQSVLRPTRKKSPRTKEAIKQKVKERTEIKKELQDELIKNIDLAVDRQPRNNNNPVIRTNQYTNAKERLEFITAVGDDYTGFYHVLEDGTVLQGRGRIGEIPVIKPELILFNSDSLPAKELQEDIASQNPDYKLIIPRGFPLGVGATHRAIGNQFYSCPPDVPITHPIVGRCRKIDKDITKPLINRATQ